ncbi:unnamed protein product, partial [marine sediment metagenome]
ILLNNGSLIKFPSHEHNYIKGNKNQKMSHHKKFLSANKDLNPNDPKNQEDIIFGVIGVYLQMQTQRDTLNEMCPLAHNLEK